MDWQASLGQMDPALLDAPITALRLPKKTELLEARGLTTVRALLGELMTGALWRIPSIGARTVRAIEERLSVLPHAIDPVSGRVSWQNYALACGFELVPDEEVASGPAFLAAFPEVIDAIIRFHNSPVDRLILTERLVRQPHERMTLDEIAHAAPEPITRERVRQRQELLLGALSNALLFDDPRELQFHFRDSFVSRWRDAAELFAGKGEIPFGDFMAGLEQVWQTSATQLFPHLPLITSILTSRAQIPHHLRQGMKLDPRLYGPLGTSLTRAPLTWLATGKALDEIRGCGIDSVGELIEAGRKNGLPGSQTSVGKRCVELLTALASALDEHGEVDWARYGAALGFPLLPTGPRDTAEEFLRNLNADLEEIVRVNGTSMRAADIFRLRTCLPQATRSTLAEVAAMLGSHGPSIKREESVLLDSLHTQLVLGDYTFSRVIGRPDFLRWWREARSVYRQSRSSYLDFCNELGRRWNLAFPIVHGHADALWAVFARYPNGRKVPIRTGRRTAATQTFDGGMVVLRGFRRVH